MWIKGVVKMSKKEDKELAKNYGEAIEKAENGESESFEVVNANELLKLIEEDK
jgi:hypothetical protein